MDEEITVSRQLEEVFGDKLEEFSGVEIDSDHAKDSAEALGKVADAYVKVKQQEDSEKSNKKDIWIKILTPVGALVGVVLGAFINAWSNQKIAREQLDYLEREHDKAYDFERTGTTEHIVTSPTSRDILRERPKNR